MATACHGQASGDVSSVVVAGRDVSAAESGLFEIVFAGGWIVESWKAAYAGPESAPLGLAAWQATFLMVGLPGLLLR